MKKSEITELFTNFTVFKWSGWEDINEEGKLPPSNVQGLYFVQGEITKRIKIGISEKINTRFSGLQTDSPDILTLRMLFLHVSIERLGKAEKFLHSLFKEYHSHGEWFNLPEFVMLTLSECKRPEYFYLLTKAKHTEKGFLEIYEQSIREKDKPDWVIKLQRRNANKYK